MIQVLVIYWKEKLFEAKNQNKKNLNFKTNTKFLFNLSLDLSLFLQFLSDNNGYLQNNSKNLQ